jgi:hypothetical protein
MTMLRVASRILNQRPFDGLPPDGYIESTFDEAVELHKATVTALQEDLPIVIADNVRVYLNNLRKQSGSSAFRLRDLPPCPPTLDYCFIEWNEPEIDYPRQETIKERGALQVGCCLTSHSDKAIIASWLMDDVRKREDLVGMARWLMFNYIYATSLQGIVFPVSMVSICLDDDGRYIPTSTYCKQYIKGDEKTVRSTSICQWEVVATTLSFMQCKNVERIDATSTEGPPPKWCRRQRVRELKYHVLRIDPNVGSKPRSGERKTEGDRSGKALHICRGHFMHCVKDGVSRGLFGRGIYGTFWVPSHVRGSADLGKVIPTYNVMAPNS